MSPVRPRRRCNSAVWASSPSNINANHCSHSINIERRVQFTSDLFLMNLDGSAKEKKKNRDDYFWIEKTFFFFLQFRHFLSFFLLFLDCSVFPLSHTLLI